MSLDMNVFEKNREFITQAADFIEQAIKASYGHDIADCPDSLLKETVDGVANTIGRALFEYLKIRKAGREV